MHDTVYFIVIIVIINIILSDTILPPPSIPHPFFFPSFVPASIKEENDGPSGKIVTVEQEGNHM